MSQLVLNEGAAPATPASGKVTLYVKADGVLYFKDDTGAESAAGLPLPVSAANGGTGIASYAVGDIVYASATTTLAKLAGVATGNVLISGGVTTAPAWGKVGLTTHVSGTLPAANGGTGIASYAVGDIVYASGATAFTALAAVATGNVLISGGVTTAPAWGKVGLTTHVSGTLPLANGGTNATSASDARTQLELAFGKQTVWVPAGAMTPRTTNGAASGSVEMTTNKNMVKTLDFDATTQEFAQFDVRMPKSWDEGTVTFIPVWSHAATVTNFGVVWGMDAVAISNDDAMDVAFGTEQTSTDTGGTTNDSYQGPESSAITIAGTPAAGDLVQFRIHRNVSDGSDTMAVDARLHGVVMLYTNNASNDA